MTGDADRAAGPVDMPGARDMEGYTDLYEAHYTGGFSMERALIEARRRMILGSMATHASRSVLEIGCGLEPLFMFAPDFEAFTVVEPSARFAENARRLGAGDPRVKIVEGFVEDVVDRLESRAFDFIVASSLLHEVPDPGRLLRSIHALSGPDTVVHVNVPNVRSFHRLLALEMGLIDSVFTQSRTEARFDRHTRFDLPSLVSMFDSHRFDVVDSGTYFIKPFTHEQMEAAVDRGAIDRAVVDGLERMAKYLPDMGAEMFVEARPRQPGA